MTQEMIELLTKILAATGAQVAKLNLAPPVPGTIQPIQQALNADVETLLELTNATNATLLAKGLYQPGVSGLPYMETPYLQQIITTLEAITPSSLGPKLDQLISLSEQILSASQLTAQNTVDMNTKLDSVIASLATDWSGYNLCKHLEDINEQTYTTKSAVLSLINFRMPRAITADGKLELNYDQLTLSQLVYLGLFAPTPIDKPYLPDGSGIAPGATLLGNVPYMSETQLLRTDPTDPIAPQINKADGMPANLLPSVITNSTVARMLADTSVPKVVDSFKRFQDLKAYVRP